MSEREYKIDSETAEQEFLRWGSAMDLDFEKSHMDEEDLQSFKDAHLRFVEAVRRGTLKVNDNGEPMFMLASGVELTFREPKGSAFLASDSRKRNHDVAKLHAVAADITEQPIQIFAVMPGREIKLVYAIVGLLLGG